MDDTMQRLVGAVTAAIGYEPELGKYTDGDFDGLHDGTYRWSDNDGETWIFAGSHLALGVRANFTDVRVQVYLPTVGASDDDCESAALVAVAALEAIGDAR